MLIAPSSVCVGVCTECVTPLHVLLRLLVEGLAVGALVSHSRLCSPRTSKSVTTSKYTHTHMSLQHAEMFEMAASA